MREVYLDWASAAPVSARAKCAFSDALEVFGNPSSPHAEGVRAKRILEDSRLCIARLVGVKSDSVIFTSGATEANNLAIRGHIQALHAKGRELHNMHVLYLPTAHASIVETVEALHGDGVQIEPIAVLDGAIDLARLAQQMRTETVLVSADAVCGETGTRWAVRDVRRVIDKYHEEKRIEGNAYVRALLHVDASQAPLVESIERMHLGADLLTLDAQKIGGVRGIGVLIRANSVIPLAPLIYGGGQEHGMRPGTENPALAAAFAVALEEVCESREAFVDSALYVNETLRSTSIAAFPDVLINVGKEAAPHILNLSFPQRDTDYAVMLLSQKGYAVSTKSACETDEEGSRAVQLLFDDTDRARSTLRISWGPSTSAADVKKFTQVLIETIHFLDSHTL